LNGTTQSQNVYGKLRFKLKPGLGDKGFFNTKAFGEGGAPFKATHEDGYVEFLSPIEGLASETNEHVQNVFQDKDVEQVIHLQASTGFSV
jgi:hypothetical protein